LQEARAHGDPYGLVVFDSLGRVKPPELNENLTADMTPWLESLASLCHEEQVYEWMIHHNNKANSPEVRDVIRGAGSMIEVPKAILAIGKVNQNPRLREVYVLGNHVPEQSYKFQVVGEQNPDEWRVDHWLKATREDLGENLQDAREVLAPGQVYTTGEVADRLKSLQPGNEGSTYGKRARKHREHWLAQKVVELVPLPGQQSSAKAIRLVETEA
jgi:hypothetical protein